MDIVALIWAILFLLLPILLLFWLYQKFVQPRLKIKSEAKAQLKQQEEIGRLVTEYALRMGALNYAIDIFEQTHATPDIEHVDADNLKTVTDYFDSRQTRDFLSTHPELKKFYDDITLTFLFEDSLGDAIQFNGETFCKLFKLNLDARRREVKNNPSILNSMVVGKAVGGSLGTMYTAAGVASAILNAGKSVDLTLATISVYFYRNKETFTDKENTYLRLLKILEIREIISDVDFKKAFYSIIWNDGDCSFTGVGKKTDGAFDEVTLTDNQKIGIALVSGMIDEAALPLDHIYRIANDKAAQLDENYLKFAQNFRN